MLLPLEVVLERHLVGISLLMPLNLLAFLLNADVVVGPLVSLVLVDSLQIELLSLLSEALSSIVAKFLVSEVALLCITLVVLQLFLTLQVIRDGVVLERRLKAVFVQGCHLVYPVLLVLLKSNLICLEVDVVPQGSLLLQLLVVRKLGRREAGLFHDLFIVLVLAPTAPVVDSGLVLVEVVHDHSVAPLFSLINLVIQTLLIGVSMVHFVGSLFDLFILPSNLLFHPFKRTSRHLVVQSLLQLLVFCVILGSGLVESIKELLVVSYLAVHSTRVELLLLMADGLIVGV